MQSWESKKNEVGNERNELRIKHSRLRSGINCKCDVWVKMSVEQKSRPGNVPDAICNFEYSLDGKKWAPLPDKDYSFTARQGKWIGAKFGFFCNRHVSKNDGGWLRIDWVKVTD